MILRLRCPARLPERIQRERERECAGVCVCVCFEEGGALILCGFAVKSKGGGVVLALYVLLDL
ncbi:hypothetical protein Hdeb2414_s0008g00285291 [Helianthus debilis subsp. tardiflorus]